MPNSQSNLSLLIAVIGVGIGLAALILTTESRIDNRIGRVEERLIERVQGVETQLGDVETRLRSLQSLQLVLGMRVGQLSEAHGLTPVQLSPMALDEILLQEWGLPPFPQAGTKNPEAKR